MIKVKSKNRTATDANTVLPAVFTIDDAKEVVAAWESLKGGRNYSPSEIQDWLVEDMKPMMDKLRKKINGR